ncbi:MAG TPA: luciferase family protein [Thermoplasmata archaeon]|nr:luciferase family protein [Thermoplasmata archaeon]
MSIRTDIERRLMSVAGLTPRESRYGHGLAFYVGRREVVHFHGDDRLDVRLTAEVIRRRRDEGELDRRVTPEGGAPNWVKVRVSEARDIALAVVLSKEAVRANSKRDTVGSA